MASNNQNLPKYLRIKESIRQDIELGKLKEGERLSSEGALIKKYSASKMTVIRALQELVNDGYLNRVQGKGTFVRHPEENSPIIGVVIPSCNMMMKGIFPSLILEIEQQIHEFGYQMLLCCGNDCEKIISFAKRTVQNKISGIIAAPLDGTNPDENHHWYKVYQEAKVPIVLLENEIEGINNSKTVRMDHASAMEEITQKVINKGHSRILLISWDGFQSKTMSLRIQGFINGIEKNQNIVEFSEISTLPNELSIGQQIDQIKTIVDQFNPSCILTIDDYLALTVFNVLEKLDYPYNTISVTGFDDLPFASTIGLTTVQQPITEQGYQSVNLLHALIMGKEVNSIMIPSQLMMRRTLQPFKKQE